MLSEQQALKFFHPIVKSHATQMDYAGRLQLPALFDDRMRFVGVEMLRRRLVSRT
jgi:hypothetical protein